MHRLCSLRTNLCVNRNIIAQKSSCRRHSFATPAKIGYERASACAARGHRGEPRTWWLAVQLAPQLQRLAGWPKAISVMARGISKFVCFGPEVGAKRTVCSAAKPPMKWVPKEPSGLRRPGAASTIIQEHDTAQGSSPDDPSKHVRVSPRQHESACATDLGDVRALPMADAALPFAMSRSALTQTPVRFKERRCTSSYRQIHEVPGAKQTGNACYVLKLRAARVTGTTRYSQFQRATKYGRAASARLRRTECARSGSTFPSRS